MVCCGTPFECHWPGIIILAGGLVIHGPSSMDYDVNLGPWLIGDHYHTNVSGLDWIPLYPENDMLPPVGLINGKGVSICNDTSTDTHCTGTGQHFETVFRKGTKYKIGVIGSMTLLPRAFWVDGHTMTVIQMDMVPVEPYVTDVLIVGTGGRTKPHLPDVIDFEM
jgi:FtsP/CotA-like multicopper oxidase with cupredoxin domain